MSKVGELSKVSKHFMDSNVVITSDIWDRDKDYPKQFLPHVGYDYRAKIGTPVYAPFDGEVVQVTPNLGSSYGRQVYVFNGMHTFHTSHYSKIDVKQGQRVKKGDLLGLSGASGGSENTYAPHVHAGLAKGRITNAGNKGSFLGDVWVDLEGYDFDQQVDYWRDEGGEFELTENVNERSEPSTSGKLIKTHSKGSKLSYVSWGNSPNYTWFKLTNGNYIAYGERGVEVYGKDNPKAVSKPVAKPKPTNVGKYANLKGATWLFVEARKDNTYPAPSVNKTTSLRERSVEVLAEDNGRVKVNIPGFDPSTLWVANSQITVTDKPRY